tara:strand:- start:123 stop:1172 length:1050 start_codon:yes stop_codon:yes gene_type:complete
MKFNDDITQSIAAAVSNVLEGKAPEEKKEEVKYPHDMFHPKTGEKEVAKNKDDHDKLNAKGYTHDKPKMESPDNPKAKGEKEFKKMHDDNVEVSGEAPDGKVTKAKKGAYYTEEIQEALGSKEKKLVRDLEKAIKKTGDLISKLPKSKEDSDSYQELSQGQNGLEYGIRSLEDDLDESVNESTKEDEVDEESEKQKKYQAFFNKALKKFGVSSPAELEGDKKKEFFDYIDKNYEATDESVKEDVRDMKNFKDRNRKGFEARAFIEIKKGNTSNKFDDDFGFTKAELVQMDKLISKIKGMHVSSFDGGSSAPASLEFYGDKSSLDKFAKDRNVLNIAKKYKTKVEVFTNK